MRKNNNNGDVNRRFSCFYLAPLVINQTFSTNFFRLVMYLIDSSIFESCQYVLPFLFQVADKVAQTKYKYNKNINIIKI